MFCVMHVDVCAGEIFQPVPYSQATPQGMPADMEEKYFLNEQVQYNFYASAHEPVLS